MIVCAPCNEMHHHPFLRYQVHAQESEKEAVKAGLSSSAVLGALFFLALSMFGVAFWLVYTLLILILS